MFDIWMGDWNLTVVVLVFCAAVVLPVQLWLCFRVRRLITRLAPALIALLVGAASLVLLWITPGWEGLIYAFGLIYAGFLLAASGLGWLLWGLARLRKRSRS